MIIDCIFLDVRGSRLLFYDLHKGNVLKASINYTYICHAVFIRTAKKSDFSHFTRNGQVPRYLLPQISVDGPCDVDGVARARQAEVGHDDDLDHAAGAQLVLEQLG